MILILDESGNTGTNWIDNNQPYFVYGGWLLGDRYYHEVEKCFEQIFAFSKAKEVKSKRIIENKMNAFYEMVNRFIVDFNTIPVVTIADKKYMIAAKIVETFFDYAYNPNVGVYLTWPSELKKALADFLYKDDEILRSFSELIANGTMPIDRMRQIKNLISDAFKKADLHDVADCIYNLDDTNLLAMVDEYSFLSEDGRRKSWLSLTVPLLNDILVNVNNIGKFLDEPIEVRLDGLQGYGETFHEIEGICQRKGFVDMISTITECDSHDEKMVQAVDLLCGFISRALVNPERYSDHMSSEIWKSLIGVNDYYVQYQARTLDTIGRDVLISRILAFAGFEYSCAESEISIIKREFKKYC